MDSSFGDIIDKMITAAFWCAVAAVFLAIVIGIFIGIQLG